MTGGEEPLSGAIDAHVHTPDMLGVPKLCADENRGLLLRGVREAGIRAAFLYAIEANPGYAIGSGRSRGLFRALEEVATSGLTRMPASLLRMLRPEGRSNRARERGQDPLYANGACGQKQHRRVEGLTPVGSISVPRPLDGVAERLEKALSLGVAGVKILPTTQPADERLYDRLEPVASTPEEGNDLFLRSGCGPSTWAPPCFRRYADPSGFEWIVRSHRPLMTVLYHIGSCSEPGPGHSRGSLKVGGKVPERLP